MAINHVGDDSAARAMADAIESIATDDFTCGMVAFDVTQEFTGAEGHAACQSQVGGLLAGDECLVRLRVERLRPRPDS